MSETAPKRPEPPARDLVDRLIERRDDLSVEAADVITGLRGANQRLREMLKELEQ